jgi:hypothetical protein
MKLEKIEKTKNELKRMVVSELRKHHLWEKTAEREIEIVALPGQTPDWKATFTEPPERGVLAKDAFSERVAILQGHYQLA